MNKETVVKTLNDLGFKTEEISAQGITFEFEGLHLLYNPEDDDEEFFRLNAPCIYKVEDDESRPMVLEIANEVNCRIKYTKTMLNDDYVWISYEAKLFDGIDAEDLVRFAILIVRASVELFHRKIKGGEVPTSL